MNILAIGAHPDDIELFCSGTLIKYSKAGHNIFGLVATNGRTGTKKKISDNELIEMRKQEQLEAAKIYNGDIDFLDYGDGELFFDNKSLLNFVNAIRWANPDIIFTHSPTDKNTDHQSCGDIVTRSLIYLTLENVRVENPPMQNTPKLYYWDNYAGIDFNPIAYVDITSEIEDKCKALACHKSQMTDDFNWENMLNVIASFRGLQSGFDYAEAFIGYQTINAMPDYKNLP